MPAAYLELMASGELVRRAQLATEHLSACRLCGWDCAIDRKVDKGPCRTGIEAIIATAYVHFGEEKPLVVGGGSGAIFFANCDLRCQFCQTYRWNIQGQGQAVTTQQLAEVMLSLQGQGARNINLVTPTHVAPQILSALVVAAENGLRLPLVWNSGGYDAPGVLRLLDGIVDIYLPDMKYAESSLAQSLSGIRSYAEVNKAAVLEMFRQVGHLQLDADGTAQRGIILRHLVMPSFQENTQRVLDWIAENLGPNTYLSLMDQYRPAYRAFARPELAKPITNVEYALAHEYAIAVGLARLDKNLILSTLV